MIILGFILLFGVLASVPAYFAVCRGRNPERLTLITLLINVLLYYISCIFHCAGTGFWLIAAGNISFLYPVIKRLRQEPSAWRKYFTPAMAGYFAVLPLLYLLTARLKFIGWDEFSHWGFVSKLLFEYGKLNCEYDCYLEHASYLPGLPLLYVFIHKCLSFAEFRENIVLFANLSVIWTILLSFSAGETGERKDVPRWLCSMAGGLLLLLCIFGNGLFSVYSEPLLVTLGGLVLFRVFTSEENIFDDLELLLLISFLLLLKSSAMGVVVFALLFYLLRVYRHRKCRQGKLAKFMPLAVTVMPFLFFGSWSLLLKYFRTDIVFQPHMPWGQAIVTLCTGRHGYAGKVTLAMCREFLSTEIVLISFILIVIAELYYCLGNRRRPAADWKVLYRIFVPVFFLTMMFSLLMTYLFVFQKFQAELLVSFERYVMTFLGMLLLAQLYLLQKELAPVKIPKKWLWLTAVLLVGVHLYNYHLILCRRNGRMDTKWQREADSVQTVYDHVLGGTQKFTLLSRKGNGMKNYIYRYIYPDQFVPVVWFNPVLNEKEHLPYSCVVKAAELKQRLEQTADYVLIDTMDESFFRDYSSIFAGIPETRQQQALYKVTPAGLVYIPPRSR